MSSCRVAQVAAAGGPFEVVEREVPQPGPGHVRIAVDACGICHSDSVFVNAMVPGVRFPLVPGHEIAGRIEAGGHRRGPRPLGISPNQLFMSGKVVRGHPSGTAQDVQDTLAFSALHGIRPTVEIVPLDEADKAYRKMMAGAARFRMVLTTD